MNAPEWLTGKHAVLAAIEGGAREVEEVFLRQGADATLDDALVQRARARRIPVRHVSPQQMQQMQIERTSVAARCAPFRYRLESELPRARAERDLVVVLDRIQDPQNLGAIIRTAEAAGARALCIGQKQSAAVTPAVVRAAAGATEFLPIHRVVNVARALGRLADLGFWSVGLMPRARQTWYEVDLSGAVALVVGAEGPGLRRLVAARCDHLVSMPMAGRTASLNASAAFAAMAYEVVRQQGCGGTETSPAR